MSFFKSKTVKAGLALALLGAAQGTNLVDIPDSVVQGATTALTGGALVFLRHAIAKASRDYIGKPFDGGKY